MRKRLVVFLIVLTASLMASCTKSEASSVYTVTQNGRSFVVDQENGTISDGEYLYHFSVSGNIQVTIEFTYPDGSTYWWTIQKYGGYGGHSDNYDPDRFVSGDLLMDVLESAQPKPSSSSHGAWAFLLIPLGLWHLLAPRSAWYLRHGWRYKDAEPSGTALAVNRAGGVVALAAALILLLV